MEFLCDAVQSAYFYVGVAACGIFVYLWCFFRGDRKRKKRAAMLEDSKIIDGLIERMHNGAAIDIANVFPCDSNKRENETSRSRAWCCFAYWMAHKYANFEYSFETKGEILRLAALCFGESSMSYSKLCALEEILNRSTKYYLGDKAERLRDLKPIEYPEKLYDLVDLIIDSMYAKNY